MDARVAVVPGGRGARRPDVRVAHRDAGRARRSCERGRGGRTGRRRDRRRSATVNPPDRRSAGRDHVNIGSRERERTEGARDRRSRVIASAAAAFLTGRTFTHTHCTCRRSSGPRAALNLIVYTRGDDGRHGDAIAYGLRECSRLHYVAAGAGAPAAAAAAAARQH